MKATAAMSDRPKELSLRRDARFVLSAFAIMISVSHQVTAQQNALSDPTRLIGQTHDAYRSAKTLQAIESIREYCRDGIATFTFKQRDAYMVLAMKFLRANDVDHANLYLEKVKALNRLDENLADLNCEPDSSDEASLRSHGFSMDQMRSLSK